MSILSLCYFHKKVPASRAKYREIMRNTTRPMYIIIYILLYYIYYILYIYYYIIYIILYIYIYITIYIGLVVFRATGWHFFVYLFVYLLYILYLLYFVLLLFVYLLYIYLTFLLYIYIYNVNIIASKIIGRYNVEIFWILPFDHQPTQIDENRRIAFFSLALRTSERPNVLSKITEKRSQHATGRKRARDRAILPRNREITGWKRMHREGVTIGATIEPGGALINDCQSIPEWRACARKRILRDWKSHGGWTSRTREGSNEQTEAGANRRWRNQPGLNK